MPELPEVETTKLSLEPLIGQTVTCVQVRHPRLRYDIAKDLDSLVGFVLTKLQRRAKYLLLDFITHMTVAKNFTDSFRHVGQLTTAYQ